MSKMKNSKIKNAAINLLFPPKCIICGERIAVMSALTEIVCVCRRCRASYEGIFLEVCPTCNLSVSACRCGVKRGRTEISPLAKCFFYKPSKENSVGNKVIFAIKHTDDKRITKLLSRELSDSVISMLTAEGIEPNECIFTFVPRRKSAVLRDGFDQGARLARYTAKACGNERGAKSVFRRFGDKEQKKLAANQREKNLQDALGARFMARRAVEGKSVCVIDDVVTSGATMRAAEKALLSWGAKRVVFACVARTKGE